MELREIMLKVELFYGKVWERGITRSRQLHGRISVYQVANLCGKYRLRSFQINLRKTKERNLIPESNYMNK